MTPPAAETAFDAFMAELTAGGTVTQVLEAWAGGAVRAERIAADIPASPETRARLRVGPDTPVAFRRVRLMRGAVTLSEADNWFVPDRLTADMRETLESTDIPFGRAIAALSPRRETLGCTVIGDKTLLTIQALVVDTEELPVAEVVEVYRIESIIAQAAR